MSDEPRPMDERQAVYDWRDLEGFDPRISLGAPGEPPFTRGVHARMYRDRLWTMRQYAGFGTAEATNERFRFLLEAGQTGLSCAFDLPTQMGIDADSPRALGEVGRVGVAISSLEDMRLLLAGLPLDSVTTSMTINATASTLLLLYQLVGEEQGIMGASLRGTVQNDILKEYIARGTYIYPPRASMRLTTDTFAYCAAELPHFNSISISGYHIREAGSTAVQELAFTLANALAYLDAARDAGLDVVAIAPRLSFFFNAHNDLFAEVAKFRAARRLWSTLLVERYGVHDERARALRFHTQTAGSTLTAQQPDNNIMRVTLQALAAVLGGTQSLHTNGFDEALGLPTEHAARLALRTQQVIAHESGVTDVVDPLAGSYYVESLTNDIEAGVHQYLEQIERLGGAVAAIEAAFPQREIERAAYEAAQRIEQGVDVVVGLNAFVDETALPIDVFPANERQQTEQVARVQSLRVRRDNQAVRATLEDLATACRGSANVLYPMKAALAHYATLGEVADVLRTVFGEYRAN